MDECSPEAMARECQRAEPSDRRRVVRFGAQRAAERPLRQLVEAGIPGLTGTLLVREPEQRQPLGRRAVRDLGLEAAD